MIESARIVVDGKEQNSRPCTSIFPVYLEIWCPIETRWTLFFTSKNGEFLDERINNFFSRTSGTTNYSFTGKQYREGSINNIPHLRFHSAVQVMHPLADFICRIEWLRKLNKMTEEFNLNPVFVFRAEVEMALDAQQTMESMKERIKEKIK